MLEKIFKNILLIIFCFIIFLIQTYIFNTFLIFNIVINLSLIILVIMTTKFDILKSIIVAMFFGTFVDIFTNLNFGYIFIPYILITFIIYKISKIYKEDNLKTSIYITVVSFIIFETIICILQMINIGQVINIFSYLHIILKSTFLNLIIMILIYKPISKLINYLKTDELNK